MVLGDAAGDVALVEASRAARMAPARPARARLELRRGHGLDRLRELGLDQEMPRRRRLAVREVERGRRGELPDLVGGAAELVRGERRTAGSRAPRTPSRAPPPRRSSWCPSARAPRTRRRRGRDDGAEQARGDLATAALALKNSAVARLPDRARHPTPRTSRRCCARCTRMGATPAKLTMSGWTTPSIMPAAHPASIALPPASRIARGRLRRERVAGRHHPAAAHHLVHRARGRRSAARLSARRRSRGSCGVW